MRMKRLSHDHPLCTAALGFVAGFIDLFGFLQWHGLLAAHVTGNLIFLAYDITRGNYHLVMRLLALPLFAGSVSVSAWFISMLFRRDIMPFLPAVLLQTAALGLCMLAGSLLPSPRGSDDWGAVIPGTIALFAMALQNTTMRLILQNMPPTTVMTGNITHVVAEWTRLAAGHQDAGLTERAKVVALTLSAFTSGAIAGGFLQDHAGNLGLLAPMAVLLGLLLPLRQEAPVRSPVREPGQ